MQTALQKGCGIAHSRVNKPSQRISSMKSAALPFRYTCHHTRTYRRSIHSSTTTKALLGDFDIVSDNVVSNTTDSLPSLLDHIAAGLTTALVLADIDPATATDAVADATTKKSGGFFSFFADAFESFIKIIDAGLAGAGVPYSYGFAIIVITVLVKVATYPLSKKQVESTLSMQALQPKVKELQSKFANDPERLQVETAKLYQNAGVNPLAGCLPTLATIPVFIGLYRALSNVADEGLLTEGFFWIPSLAGPTKLNGGLGWLTLQDGAPPLGWHDTLSYLVLPILLIISQYASQKIISPPQSNDPAQQQSQAILKFIPLMIGWFSLNVPSGLTLYWFTNNIITTAQQVYLRKQFGTPATATAGSGSVSGTYVAPKKEEEDNRPTGKELNARRSMKSVIDVEAEVVGNGASSSASSRGEKFKALKAKEAAAKTGGSVAAASAVVAGSEEVESSDGVVTTAQVDKVDVPNAAPSKGGSRGKGSKKGSKKK